MSKEENKKQHYIPVCYLKKFSGNGKFVYVYNKNTSAKPYPCSVENIFNKEYFYKIPIELIPSDFRKDFDPLWIERTFFRDNIESQYSDFLNELVFLVDDIINSGEDINQYRIPIDYKIKLATYTIIQYFRTPEARNAVLDFINRIETTLSPINGFLKDKYGESIFPFLSESKKNHHPVMTHFAALFLNPKLIGDIAEAMSKNIWQIYVTKDNFYYTSDQPIMIENFSETIDNKFSNLNLYGNVLTFPLSRKIVAKMYDREFFSKYEKSDRGCIYANNDFVTAHNVKMYLWAKEYVVSYSDDFSIVKHCIETLGKEYSVKHEIFF